MKEVWGYCFTYKFSRDEDFFTATNGRKVFTSEEKARNAMARHKRKVNATLVTTGFVIRMEIEE